MSGGYWQDWLFCPYCYLDYSARDALPARLGLWGFAFFFPNAFKNHKACGNCRNHSIPERSSIRRDALPARLGLWGFAFFFFRTPSRIIRLVETVGITVSLKGAVSGVMPYQPDLVCGVSLFFLRTPSRIIRLVETVGITVSLKGAVSGVADNPKIIVSRAAAQPLLRETWGTRFTERL